MYPIITISREFASGGHSIAEKVAQKLNLPFFDDQIIREVAAESGYKEEMIREQGEYTRTKERLFGSSFYSASYFESPQEKLFQIQKEIIIKHAKESPCVIVGRCADYILEEAGIPTLNVFIHADMEHRKERAVERYQKDDITSIEKTLRRKDKGRMTYYKYFTDRFWGDYHNYHLMLDSGYFGEEFCVEMIIKAAMTHS